MSVAANAIASEIAYNERLALVPVSPWNSQMIAIDPADHRKIIALWGVPRAVSTAFEKTFTRRPDTIVVHEPFTPCYYFSRWRVTARYGNSPEYLDFDGERAIAEVLSQQAPIVFVKDIVYQVIPYLKNTEFLKKVTNTFILRHPRITLASNKQLEPVFPKNEFGFDELGQLWDLVVGELGQEPIVVEGTRFQKEPERVLRQYCARVGIDFMPEMLHWEDGRIREWQPHEELAQSQWHQTLEQSQTIQPPPEDDPSCVRVGVRQDEEAMMERAIAVYKKLSPYAF